MMESTSWKVYMLTSSSFTSSFFTIFIAYFRSVFLWLTCKDEKTGVESVKKNNMKVHILWTNPSLYRHQNFTELLCRQFITNHAIPPKTQVSLGHFNLVELIYLNYAKESTLCHLLIKNHKQCKAWSCNMSVKERQTQSVEKEEV